MLDRPSVCYNRLDICLRISGAADSDNRSIYMLRLSKGEGEFQNTAYWGSIILSTSKALMQRGVRCAELGGPSAHVLYTDTDR